jgi:hypothetical protein
VFDDITLLILKQKDKGSTLHKLETDNLETLAV